MALVNNSAIITIEAWRRVPESCDCDCPDIRQLNVRVESWIERLGVLRSSAATKARWRRTSKHLRSP
jgi:hypothetical protein